MEASEFRQTVEAMHAEAKRRGLFFLTCGDQPLRDRTINLDGQDLLSFSSCSYLGLEQHPALIEGAKKALDRYGTQFSSSRGYLSAPAYIELEELLGRLFGGHVLVTPSTTLGHQIALATLLTEKDAMVLDHQVHHSVQMASTLARASGAHVELVRHNEIERSEALIYELARTRETVWFACDGVFSMYGDLAPIGLLKRLLAIAPNVRLYVDDAHGMSWAGKHGRGSFLSRMPLSDRIVVATSLNKAFAAAGGCLIFSSAEERDRVRMGGGPQVFSGPIQPPMLGAAIASAKVHMSDEIEVRQSRLSQLIRNCNAHLRARELPLLVENQAPIFFIEMGLPRVAMSMAERLKREGIYVNVSLYPSVPMNSAGIRLALTAAHTEEQVERVVDSLATHFPEVLASEGVALADIERLFEKALPPDSRAKTIAEVLHDLGGAKSSVKIAVAAPVEVVDLQLEQFDSIAQIDREEWNLLLGARGTSSHEALQTAEAIFSNQQRPEHNWKFHYFLVRDTNRRVVCATYFTSHLSKDDMLMREEVSRVVEERRKEAPYFLTSRILSMGSHLSEGNHLYLDRLGPWQQALSLVLAAAKQEYEKQNANMVVVRDLPDGDEEMDGFLLQHGLLKVPVLDSHHIDLSIKDDDQMLQALSARKRKFMREQLARMQNYVARVYDHRSTNELSKEARRHLYELYRNVAERNMRLNVFPLPANILDGLLQSPAWEIVTLELPEDKGGPSSGLPIAWFAAHKHNGHYAPFFCGLDYEYVFSHFAYRQLLLRMIMRAREHKMTHLHLGMDADLEKERLGSSRHRNVAYAQARDHYNTEVLREIVAEVGVRARTAASSEVGDR